MRREPPPDPDVPDCWGAGCDTADEWADLLAVLARYHLSAGARPQCSHMTDAMARQAPTRTRPVAEPRRAG